MPLGILLENENKGSEMVEILTHLHQYIPYKESTKEVRIPSLEETVPEPSAKLTKILFGGDQLTAAKARSAIAAMSNASSPVRRLEGIVPVIEDWHAQVTFLEVRLIETAMVILYM